MSEIDYWHKVGGQRWLAERLAVAKRTAVALERIADALEGRGVIPDPSCPPDTMAGDEP